jgi:hypothetical protein
MDVRIAPELRWIYDDSLDRSFRIEQMLRDTGTTDKPPVVPTDEPKDDGSEE